MPKNSSKSKKDWVSGDDLVYSDGPSRWQIVAAIFVLILILGIAAFYFWKPKAPTIEGLLPSGSIVLLRVNHVHKHLFAFRSSAFWREFSKVNVPKLLEHSEVNSKAINDYNNWRSSITGVIDNPLFKQFLGREVAVAFYPTAVALNAQDLPGYLSGVVIATRLDSKARVVESLASFMSQWNPDAKQETIHYKSTVITAIHLNEPNPVIFYTKVNDVLFVSLDRSLLAAVIDVSRHEQSSMREDPDFNLAASSFYKNPDGFLYVSVSKVRSFLGDRWERILKDEYKEGVGMYERLNKSLSGFDGITTNGISFAIGSVIKSKMAVGFDKSKLTPQLAAMYSCAPMENKTLTFVPQEAVMYQWANCLDFTAYYEKLKTLAPQNKDATQKLSSPFAELEKHWGFTVENDVLPILGREFGWFVEGVEMGGLFPIPKLTFFVSIKDQKAAQEIVKKIVTTPVTIVQTEEYQQFKVNFVSIPLFTSFKPSYTFIGDYLLISTSNDLLKLSIDALQDPAKSLRFQPVYKDLGGQDTRPSNVVSFLRIGDVARQSKAFVDWVDHWFSMKVKQADNEEQSIRTKMQSLKNEIQTKEQELKSIQEQLEQLKHEITALETVLNASALQLEAADTLSKPGPMNEDGAKAAVPSLEEVQKKRAESADLQSKVEAIRRVIEASRKQQPDLEDDLEDFDQQKKDAQNFRYFVDEVVVPLLKGMESLSGQLMTTAFGDSVIETEFLLKAE